MRLLVPLSRASRLFTAGEKLAERTAADFQAKEEALVKLRKARLSIPKRPVDEEGNPLSLSLPRDLAATSSEKLGQLMTQFTSQADFIAVAATEADIELNVAEHVYERIQAMVRLQKEGTVQERADQTMVDPEVKAAAQNYYRAVALSKMTQTLLHACERDLNAISREITRRANEMGRPR